MVATPTAGAYFSRPIRPDLLQRAGTRLRSRLDPGCIRALDLCDRLGFSMMTYDFLFRHEEPVILEVSLRFLKEVRGYWNRDLEWIDEPVTPQEAAVDAFLDTLGHGAKRSS